LADTGIVISRFRLSADYWCIPDLKPFDTELLICAPLSTGQGPGNLIVSQNGMGIQHLCRR